MLTETQSPTLVGQQLSRYSVFTIPATSLGRAGEGVLAVRQQLPFSIDCWQTNQANNTIWLTLKPSQSQQRPLVLGVCYIPRDSHHSVQLSPRSAQVRSDVIDSSHSTAQLRTACLPSWRPQCMGWCGLTALDHRAGQRHFNCQWSWPQAVALMRGGCHGFVHRQDSWGHSSSALQHAVTSTDMPANLCTYVLWTSNQPKVQWQLLWSLLQRLGVHGHMLGAVWSLYDGSLLSMRVNDQCGHSQRPSIGLRQGCPLSAALFGIFIDGLHHHL